MSVDLNRIESDIRRLGASFGLMFVAHRGGYRFALTGEKISADAYRLLEARFASSPPPVSAVVTDIRRNNLRHRSLG